MTQQLAYANDVPIAARTLPAHARFLEFLRGAGDLGMENKDESMQMQIRYNLTSGIGASRDMVKYLGSTITCENKVERGIKAPIDKEEIDASLVKITFKLEKSV